MPKMQYRSRTFRRVFVRTPGGQTVLRYRRRRNAVPQCAECGASLPGTARGTPAQVRSQSRSSRRPSRPYGGMLCSMCTRRTIIAKARQTVQA